MLSSFAKENINLSSMAVAILKEYNNQISTLLSNFSDSDRFRSLPGVDAILAGKLLVFIGTNRERFSSASYKATSERRHIPRVLGNIVVCIFASVVTRQCELL